MMSAEADESTPAGTAVFVAPHYDDVPLSCGAALAMMPGSTVLTVFSAEPEAGAPISDWDLECGFAPGDDVATIRAREDQEALGVLGVRGSGLGFAPARTRAAAASRPGGLGRIASRLRVRRGPDAELELAITARLADALEASAPGRCIFPLGLSHPDHVLTARSALALVRDLPRWQWVAYADLPYSVEHTGALAEARARVAALGLALEPIILTERPDREKKRRAVERYRSQIRGLGDRAELALASEERFFELSPSRDGFAA